MSNEKHAFPSGDGPYGGGPNHDYGMTLRDWFAGQAIAGGLARTSVPEWDLRAMFGEHRTAITRDEILAADAYRIADAMLKARATLPGGRDDG